MSYKGIRSIPEIDESVLNRPVNFGVYTTDGATIEKNGIVVLNDWAVASMRTLTVSPTVDYIQLMPWDAKQTGSSYSTVLIPLDAEGTEHHTVRYMTNTPVHIYRNAGSSGSPYSWSVKYEGYDSVRPLGSTAATFELKAGKRTITGSGAIFQGNVTSSWTIDEFVRIRHVITSGTSVDMQLQLLASETKDVVHHHYSYNLTPRRVIGDISDTSTNVIIDTGSTNQEVAFIDTLIHSTMDGSGSWLYKYKGRITHHNNNNMHWCFEAEYNPQHVV